MDRISYALGMAAGSFVAQSGCGTLHQDDFLRAVTAVVSGEKTEMTWDEARAEMEKAAKDVKSELKKRNEEWLAGNSGKEGVVTLPSGLQYKVITEGTGNRPGPHSKVRCHYSGTLIDGSRFDSSYAKGEPVTFSLDTVIRGWQEGLQLMTAGSKYELYVPYQLGYGETGISGVIPPYSTLIFTVELLDII